MVKSVHLSLRHCIPENALKIHKPEAVTGWDGAKISGIVRLATITAAVEAG